MAFRRSPKPARVASAPLRGLSDREFLILRALQGNVRQGLYGIEIRDTVSEEYGMTLPWGSLYVMLGRLVEKGFAERIDGEPSARNLKARRQYYRLTAEGAAACTQKAALFHVATRALTLGGKAR